MGEAELGHLGGVLQAIGEHHDDREDHRRRSDDGRPDEHWLGGGLEGVSRPILSLQEVLGHLPPGSEAELGLHLLVDVGQLLDGRQLVDALGVVGDRPVGVDGNRHRAHAEETEGHQTEGEDGPLHLAHRAHVTQARSGSRDQKCGTHEGDDRHTQPVSGEVAGHQTRQDVQRRPALLGAGDDLAHVTGVGGGEGLDQFGDEGSGQGAARDDDGEFPPHGAVTHAAEHPPRRQGREQDRHRRGDPHQTRQGFLEVELVNLAVLRTGDGVVDEV